MGYAKRQDANHAAIVDALERCGWHVYSTAALGGFFDVVAVRRGVVVFVEIKDGRKPPSARRLRPNQHELHDRFQSAGARTAVIESIADVEAISRLANPAEVGVK